MEHLVQYQVQDIFQVVALEDIIQVLHQVLLKQEELVVVVNNLLQVEQQEQRIQVAVVVPVMPLVV
jgi:hypothetical protein